MCKEPIRVLQVVPNMNAGGLETLIMNLYRNIDREKIQFDFLLHYDGDFFYSDEIRKLGGHIYNLTVRDDNNFLKYIRDLDTFFSNHKEYNIVHGHMVSTAVFYLHYAKKYGCKVRIVHSHNTNTVSGFKGLVKKMLAKWAVVPANTYFACGELAGKSLYGKKKFVVLNNGIDINRFRYSENIRKEVRKEINIEKNHVYGHVGRFNMQKNHKFLLEIFKEICKLDDKALLLLVGMGELEEDIFNQAKEMGIFNRIKYLGVRDDVNRLYQAMDIFILPSFFEGFPVVATECQASGLPMLVSDSVTREIKITPCVHFLSLDDDTKKWAKTATEIIKEKRHDYSEEVENSGYEIKNIANKLQNFYIENAGVL